MLRRQSNIEEVFVAKATDETADREGNDYGFLANSEIAVFTEGGKIADTTTGVASKTFKIGYKTADGELIMSDIIDPKTVKNYKGKKSVATAEQVTYIGYNGTSGDIVAANSTSYIISLWFNNDTLNGSMDRLVKYGAYKSDSSAISKEIAAGLALSLYNNLKNELEYRVKVERVSNGTLLALGTSVDNVTFTKGSQYFTATDIDDATVNAALAVGDVIVIGSATTSPRYIITEIDTVTNIGKLDVPFAGDTVTVADTGLRKIAAAGVDALTWGLKLTGVAKTWSLGLYPFNKVKFDIELENFGTTGITYTTAASVGIGAYETVAEAEWFAQGNEGGMSRYRVRGDSPAQYIARKEATSGKYYSTLSFTHYHSMQSEIGPLNNSPKQVVIFMEAPSVTNAVNATSITDAGTGLKVVLDAIMVAAETGTAQTGNV